ncbi:MAG: TetR/AcrR family transcriptional regulator [Solirubrobacterales bacterium]|nr:TetR/AcrR family transcriptional regulator [Solirubrobacterales bacterium]
MALAEKQSPRERLLQAADQLFYAEGIQSVGIDRVIERAGVAKASLYSSFGSKEELVRAYLDERHQRLLARRRRAAESADSPANAILAMFDQMGSEMKRPEYNGCAFSRATAETPEGGVINDAADRWRADILALYREYAAAAGASDPNGLAIQLRMLADGGSQAGKLDRDPALPGLLRQAVQALLDAELPTPR